MHGGQKAVEWCSTASFPLMWLIKTQNALMSDPVPVFKFPSFSDMGTLLIEYCGKYATLTEQVLLFGRTTSAQAD